MSQYSEKTLKRSLTLLGLIFLLLFTIIPNAACEPAGWLVVENQRNEDVSIYVTHVRENGSLAESIDYGVVQARSTKELAGITFLGSEWINRIQAKDSSGKVVFSHDYKLDEMKKIDWKIVIPPS